MLFLFTGETFESYALVTSANRLDWLDRSFYNIYISRIISFDIKYIRKNNFIFNHKTLINNL